MMCSLLFLALLMSGSSLRMHPFKETGQLKNEQLLKLVENEL